VAAAQNTGIKASHGEYISILGSDDLYLPQNLEDKVKLLDSRPDIGLVFSDAYLFDDNTGATLGRFWYDPNGSHVGCDPVKARTQPLEQLLRFGCFFAPQASMIRRQVFDEVGYFDESLATHEDWDLFIRIVRRFPIEIIDLPLIKLRRHSNNLTKNDEKMYLDEVVVYNKLVRSHSLSRAEIKLLDKRLMPHHFWYGRLALHHGREAAARKALFAYIRINPRKIKPYIYFVLSFLGTRKIMTLKSWKKNLRHSLGHRHPLGNTRSIRTQG
jgi:GT2 family glycosyltransferase